MAQNQLTTDTPVTLPPQTTHPVTPGYYADVVFLVIIFSLLGLTPRRD